MTIDPGGGDRHDRGKPSGGRSAAIIVAAVLGLVLAALVYLVLNPLLEGRNDRLEEFQGFLFNIIPLGAVAGGLLGWWASRRFGGGQ